MTKPDLTGVRLKLDRAAHHIEAVRQDIESFRDREPPPFGFRTEEHPGPAGAAEYVLHAVIREPPPRELALPIGDAVQNMRSALDHLAYELASPKARKSGQTSFPIHTDECRFKVLGAPRIASIRGRERELIERVQPFAATRMPDQDPLET